MKPEYYGRIKGVVIGLLGLSLVIIVHELGHFIACKIFGVYTPTFSIGFDPRLFGIKIGTTEFQVGALPLGGYVSIDPDALAAVAYWKKMVIVLAGIASNILFAFGIFFFLLARTTKKPIPIIESIAPGSPAEQSGLQKNDTIVAFDGQRVDENLTTFLQKTTSSPSKTLMITIERDGHQLHVPVTLASEHPLYGAGVGYLGTSFQTITIPAPPLTEILQHTKLFMSSLFSQMSGVMASIFKTNKKGGLIGPIGIITGIGRSAEYGLSAFLFLIATINLNLAFFNILPIPFFDGGKALQFTIEAMVGKSVPAQALSFIYLIFMFLLVSLVVTITIGDVRALRKK